MPSISLQVVLVIAIPFLPTAEGFIPSGKFTCRLRPTPSTILLQSFSDDSDSQISQNNISSPQVDNALAAEDSSAELIEQLALPEDPFQATGQEEIIRTLAGGPALIFEMARKSILFVREADTNAAAIAGAASTEQSDAMAKRWYPFSGVQENNPSFRTSPPVMSNQAFAKTIWKNVRKRNEGFWRHALRTYDRMTILEKDPNFPNIQRSNAHRKAPGATTLVK